MLVLDDSPLVYDRVSAAGTIVPGGLSSDPNDDLPGIDGVASATIAIDVERVKNDMETPGRIPSGLIEINYETGNCSNPLYHCFHATSAVPNLDFPSGYQYEVWNLLYPASDKVWMEGNMEVTIDNVVQNQDGSHYYILEITEGTGQNPDEYLLKIWHPNADQWSDPPTYQASGYMTGSFSSQKNVQ